MLSHVLSSAVLGVDAYEVDVEVDVSSGMAGSINLVGLPDAAVKESVDRVRSAIRNSGMHFPYDKRITINLAPADIRKAGPSFDLPIAIGLLAATGQIPEDYLAGAVIIGELSLDGAVRPVNGALPVAMGARERQRTRLFVPAANAREASVVEGLDVYPVQSLPQLATALALPDTLEPLPYDPQVLNIEALEYPLDFADVKGQAHVKRALEVAAAGGHNVLLIGPPGSGKTMMASRLPGILPPMTSDEALAATRLYSVAGLLSAEVSLVTTRPYRKPHHTVSTAALAGGGTIPRPGEVSLAHHGVLFLDELPEFGRDALEVLRQPLEDGVVSVARVSASYTFPASFTLIAAMNPCPCGYYGDAFRQCICSQGAVAKYQKRISGPLLDRIDLHIDVPRVPEEDLLHHTVSEGTAAIRQRVCRARHQQAARFASHLPTEPDTSDPASAAENIREEGGQQPFHPHRRRLFCNAQMGPKEIRAYCKTTEPVRNLLRAAIQQLGLSARAYDRLLKVGRTIADLDGCEQIAPQHIAEAIQYRSLDRKLWGA
ncbi:MAG: YifB family Mg chelatase-like AAA ATPase [Armatimonadetes bacterium]|nr:YifB family Mg chelatase-like AAA ATPase [Armatimonadota bacterium]MDE2207509.1 YifB family Mg chelatase-like AAA ATPase [Armatimonadota bacterium]